MGFGSNGAILRVDLSSGRTSVEAFDEPFWRQYPGGRALAVHLLLRECPANVDPLGPDNVLVLAAGLLTGAPVSTATRFTAVARSPLTGAFGESEAGGFWGPELKMAGFDAVVVTGRAPEPVYLWVRDGTAEIRDARHLWGKTPPTVQAAIKDEVGEKHAKVLQVGPAGERGVRYAVLMNELRHYNGRAGMGTVMGAKNLRAVAVRGSGRYLDLAHDPAALGELGRRLSQAVKDDPRSWSLRTKGTPVLTDTLNAAGILPTRNFRQGAFEGVDGIGLAAYDRHRTGQRSCYACAVRCKPQVEVDDRHRVTDTYDGPEYEAVAGFGPDCGVDDIQAVMKANELCNEHGIDVISASATIAFAMECFEHGLIGPADTDGIELRFGNAEAMLLVVDRIGRREGFGDLLADGARRAAEVIGGGAGDLAMHVKGQELPMHDPRGKVGVALGYATNEAGADHLVAFHDGIFTDPASLGFRSATPLGVDEPFGPLELNAAKVRAWFLGESWTSCEKSIGFCYFGPSPRSFIPVEDVVAAVRAASGWEVTVAELLEIGERATNLARLFNAREGFSRADDRLPPRLHQPLENGPLAGTAIDRQAFEGALTSLYTLKGWDPSTGLPTRERLRRLDIEWGADLAGIA
ncbi:MAG: aldehyde ferredoxin oxidoreductase family protein [Chloroflexi bacterium]|jgi:aldehyde:ferredoxin oxidoreductase|nr:aldehyde ferredoxin oxidoreductase family protein [Chloroflexota bacterium]